MVPIPCPQAEHPWGRAGTLSGKKHMAAFCAATWLSCCCHPDQLHCFPGGPGLLGLCSVACSARLWRVLGARLTSSPAKVLLDLVLG